MKRLIALVTAFFLALAFAGGAAHAQATRTWVSGVGDDANPCSRTAPCKTFAGAISKTAANGEINVLDPGGFGAVTITKSIVIDGLGPMSSILAVGTNGVIIRHGYVVGEFGDVHSVVPTYSVAKSMLATVTGIAVRNGLIKDLDAPVGSQIKDGGYDSPQNAKVTWRHHLHQETEWEGEMWGKKHDFVGREAFGDGERKPRTLQAPGTHYEYNDVRINRLGLSLLRSLGAAADREQAESVSPRRGVAS